MLRDRIITGVFDKKLQLKLLDGRDERLEPVVDLCKTFESANVNEGILDARKQVVAAVSSVDSDEMEMVNAINRRFCFNCGGDWKPDRKGKCPAKYITCQCGKKGHFLRMCRKRNNKLDARKMETQSQGKSQINNLK